MQHTTDKRTVRRIYKECLRVRKSGTSFLAILLGTQSHRSGSPCCLFLSLIPSNVWYIPSVPFAYVFPPHLDYHLSEGGSLFLQLATKSLTPKIMLGTWWTSQHLFAEWIKLSNRRNEQDIWTGNSQKNKQPLAEKRCSIWLVNRKMQIKQPQDAVFTY